MKTLTLILLLSFSSLSFAQDATELSLKTYMQKIGGEFGQIAMVLRSKEATVKELGHVKALQNYIANAALIYPETAMEDSAKLDYSNLMARLMKEALKLEIELDSLATLNNEDTTALQAVIRNMGLLRREGHGKFKL